MDLDKLLEEHDPLMKRIAKNTNIWGWDWEDILQEFRMVLVNVADKFDDKSGKDFEAYLILSCQNRVRNIIRATQAKRRPQVYLNLDTPNDDFEVSPLDLIPSDEGDYDKEKIAEIVELLSKMKHGKITLDYFLGRMSFKETAKNNGIGVSKTHVEHMKNIERVKNAMKIK